MKEVKVNLKRWQGERKFSNASESTSLEQKLKQLDESGQDNEESFRVFWQLQKVYENEMSRFKQKARLKWDSEGERNSRFFHLSIF